MNILNQPPQYGIIRDLLGCKMIEDLLKYAQLKQPFFDDATVGYSESTRIDKSIRISNVLRNIDDLRSQFESKLMEIMPIIFEKLKNKPFIPDKFEMEMVAHGDGAFFSRHIDTVIQPKISKSRRVVSAVYYFHAMPKAFSGGALRLHSLDLNGQHGSFVDLDPIFDTLVFFPSWFPHEVLPIICPSKRFIDSRFAINIWIHERLNSVSSCYCS